MCVCVDMFATCSHTKSYEYNNTTCSRGYCYMFSISLYNTIPHFTTPRNTGGHDVI